MSLRAAVTIAMLSGVALIAAPVWSPHSSIFIWNASASVPIGFYAVAPIGDLRITDLVVITPPAELAVFLAERGYLPSGVPMLKRILALAGDTVCRHDRTIIAFDATYGEALDRDSTGRPLPSWQGCRTLAPGEVFLMNWTSADSFDGRYFGPLPLSAITGRVVPLWVNERDDDTPTVPMPAMKPAPSPNDGVTE